jgi:hypothetical protein
MNVPKKKIRYLPDTLGLTPDDGTVVVPSPPSEKQYHSMEDDDSIAFQIPKVVLSLLASWKNG